MLRGRAMKQNSPPRAIIRSMRSIARVGIATALSLGALSGCRSASNGAIPELGAMPFSVDSVATQNVTTGVARRMVRSATGPWTINVLYTDLDRCNVAEAVKGADVATGRYRTSALLDTLATHEQVVGGVNGDFFNLKDGSPTNLLIVKGRMITPPNGQPVLALDSAGVPHIARFTIRDGVLAPFHPMNAIGGRGILVRNGQIDADVDTVGNAGFRARNPRTAAGITRNGRQLMLVTVDGREYRNAGMTLRELARLMLALGARDAVNLDGGGSTTFVYADPDSSGSLRVANHPSDKEGERTVGDALAIVHTCSNINHSR